ncbi:MAG: ABC transporter ATP-binding protein [Acidimicrobiales bacterium]
MTSAVPLSLRGVTKRFGDLVAVDDVSVEIPAGALVSFLGPSGCGKTTVCRIVAGLEQPSAGTVHLDGADITDQPTHRRRVGMVFQSLALFPHLDVARNIGYPLRVAGRKRADIRRRVDELLDLVRLQGYGGRSVQNLSGGQRQRVAIARALAGEPALFLLDEPMSALDANLRETLQVELRLLQQRLGITTVMVTHDQREAMTMSDLVVVMNQGRIEQTGPPLEVYRRPSTAFVARFMGATNLLAAKVVDPDTVEITGGHPLGLPSAAHGRAPGGKLLLSVRPGDMTVRPGTGPEPARTVDVLTGEMVFVRDLGSTFECFVDCGLEDHLVVSGFSRDLPAVAPGDPVELQLHPDRCVVVNP